MAQNLLSIYHQIDLKHSEAKNSMIIFYNTFVSYCLVTFLCGSLWLQGHVL